MRRVRLRIKDRHLVRPPRALQLVPINLLRTRPPLRRPQNDHRPPRPLRRRTLRSTPRLLLDRANLQHAPLRHLRHQLMHLRRIVPFNDIRLPSIPLEHPLQLLRRDPRQHRRVRDLVTVQVKYRQHRPVPHRIQKLIRMPRRSQRPGLRLTVPHDDRNNQIRIIERRAKPMRQAIPQLAPFMDRPRRLRRAMASNPTRKRKLLEELLHPRNIFALVRIHLRINAFKIAIRQRRRRPMSRPRDINQDPDRTS